MAERRPAILVEVAREPTRDVEQRGAACLLRDGEGLWAAVHTHGKGKHGAALVEPPEGHALIDFDAVQTLCAARQQHRVLV